MQPVLAKADAAGQPCYLETQNESNLSFYSKFGFEAVNDGKSPADGLGVWAMVRKAAK